MQPSSWSLILFRLAFLVWCAAAGVAVDRLWIGFFSGMGLIGLEMLADRLSFPRMSHVLVGLLAGLLGAAIVMQLLEPALRLPWFAEMQEPRQQFVLSMVSLATYSTLAFFGVALALRSNREEFALMIPYVRFRRDASLGEPLVLDARVVIDGRVAKLLATGFLSGALIIPRLVLEELQALAESAELGRAARGKRGLEMLATLRGQRGLDVTVQDDGLPADATADARIVWIARSLHARLVTLDENLAQVGRLRGVAVLNLQELVKALHMETQIGDELDLQLTKPGKDKGQAVGYLPDGAMVVVNQGAAKLGEKVSVIVIGMTHTTAGKLVFAELAEPPV